MSQLIYIGEVDVVVRCDVILYVRQSIFLGRKGLLTIMTVMGYRYLLHGLLAAVFLR
jgi:hypothetical protein